MNDKEAYWLLLERLTPRQWVDIKGSITDIDNRFNEIFLSFSPLNHKFSLDNRIIDIFPNYFLFHPMNRKSKNSIKTYLCKLNDITLYLSTDSHLIIVVLDASIKNNVITLISHIHVHNSSVIKMIHHKVNITSTEAELFVIRCSINQAIYLPNINQIIVITDSIHATKRIFDSLSHPYQLHLSAISCKLRDFFKRDNNNYIEFWNCPSHCKWYFYNIVDKEMKKFDLIPIFSCKYTWDFSRKTECDNILNS